VGAGSAIGAYLAFNGTVDGGVNLLIAALGNGIGLGVSITATMAISGGALNPAVSIGLLVGGKLSPRDTATYIVAEVLGAIAGAFSLVAVAPRIAGNAVYWGSPSNSLTTNSQIGLGILAEAIMTFFLVFVVYFTIVDERAPRLGGLLVGLIVLCDVFIGGPLTGAAMNPARATGPIIVAGALNLPGAFTDWYVFWIGPIIGGIIAGIAWRALKQSS
jgi:aquaporin Z